MSIFKPETLAEIEAAIPADGPGLRPHEIHKALGKWARVTIRHACRELVRSGRVTFSGDDGYRLYKRTSA